MLGSVVVSEGGVFICLSIVWVGRVRVWAVHHVPCGYRVSSEVPSLAQGSFDSGVVLTCL